jgi:outer membrane protein TolC
MSGCFVIGAALDARRADALEPLSTFLRSAHTQSFDVREQAATIGQRREETRQAWWKLAPTATASATYTYNQYEAVVSFPIDAQGDVRTATFTPQNQYDVVFAATVPIVDVGAWERIGVARRNEDAARAQSQATVLDVDKNVAQAYFQLVAAEAVLDSANKRRDTAKANLDYVTKRHDMGVALELDFRRATSEFERTRQDVADADYQVKIARRSLATLSGREPEPGVVAISDDTTEEAPLTTFQTDVSALPSVRAAIESVRAADRNTNATRAAFFPTVSATATERITNAIGFGASPYYTLAATATWRFDGSTIYGTAAASRAADVAHVREERARRAAEDVVFDAYQTVVREIEKTRAARAECEATVLAASIAHQRYEAGTATYLDVITAERDDFAARVSLIQASADLAYARIALRIAAGRSPGEP